MANVTSGWSNQIVEWTQYSISLEDFSGYSTYALLYLFLTLVAYYSLYSRSHRCDIAKGKRILVVIAHPDDECMFFGPTIVSLTEEDASRVHMLCLTKGDYDGEGSKRQKELWDSCERLGVLPSNITLFHSDLFPDNPKVNWDIARLANLVLGHVEKLDIDRLITFDDDGVSGHSNHIDVYRCVFRLVVLRQLPKNCRVFALDSVGLIRKYSAIVDSFPSWLGHESLFVVSPRLRNKVAYAMHAHASQLIWFRKLYLIASRYLFINGYTEVTDDFNLNLG